MMFFNLLSVFTLLLTLCDNVLSTRTIQYCRHRGQNGNAEICLAVNTFYNSTTDASDFYMTLMTYRYKSSKKGWVALGLGSQMAGALMFIAYGDPELGEMTVSTRTATGHHPVGIITDTAFYDGPIPEILVADAKFEPYTGGYVNEKLGFSPSHFGTAHIVCYDCKKWAGFEINNATTMGHMIWATQWVQDMGGDYGNERQIEAHKMGLGFGPLWVDFQHAQITAPTPHFPAFDWSVMDKGVSEIGLEPLPPTDSELDAEDSSVKPLVPDPEKVETTKASTEQTPPPPPPPSQPARTVLGKTIRDWMWHLHGLCMCLSFLILYPLGAALVRTSDSRAFNFHWTTQALASVLVFIGGVIGYWQSSGISVAHQYFGIGIMLAIAGQILLGWRHHVAYLKVARKTSLIRIHVWLGRLIFVSGFVNILMGLLLRRYHQGVIFCAVAAMLVEVVGMLYVLGKGEILKLAKIPTGKTRNVYGVDGEGMSAREAEEYFQLVGEEGEEDGLSEDGDERGGQRNMTREEEKREQQKRLARLDRV